MTLKFSGTFRQCMESQVRIDSIYAYDDDDGMDGINPFHLFLYKRMYRRFLVLNHPDCSGVVSSSFPAFVWYTP